MSYQNYNIPVPPIPRACTTYTLVRHLWKWYEFAYFVVHALPGHVNRPLDITVIPKKFDPNDIEEGKFFGIISKYRPKNFLTDLEIKSNSIFGMSARHVFYDEFIDDFKEKSNMNDKDLMKKLSTMTNEEIEQEAKELMNDGIPKELIKPLWEDEMLKEQIANTTDEVRETFRKSWDEIMEKMHVKNSHERKRQLMRLEKEMLVDMVFDLESRNEFLLHNLSEVEKMYNKLKEEV